MFENIEQYMLKSAEERKSHLDLSVACIEIGGGSQQFRGLLAHYLKTTLSTSRHAILCHACHSAKCSNPKHLYWGTYSENLKDAEENGNLSISEKLSRKYTPEEIRTICSNAGKAPRKRYGNRYSVGE